MAETRGFAKLVSSLEKKSLRGKKTLRLDVGYNAPYAIFVHENLQAHHTSGQAKFLEIPARTLSDEMADIVARSVAAKNGLEEGLLRAGRVLLSASQQLVPVATGVLRDSGYVAVVNDSSK